MKRLLFATIAVLSVTPSAAHHDKYCSEHQKLCAKIERIATETTAALSASPTFAARKPLWEAVGYKSLEACQEDQKHSLYEVCTWKELKDHCHMHKGLCRHYGRDIELPYR